MKCVLRKISPTALSTFETSPTRFVMTYVLQKPRPPQTAAMAVGSAFDAFIKGRLLADLREIEPSVRLALGDVTAENAEELTEKLLVQQVEPHVLDAARIAGRDAFDRYLKSRAYDTMLKEIVEFADLRTVRCEFNTQYDLIHRGLKIPIGGKADFACITKEEHGTRYLVVFDWKVNGYYSKASTGSCFLRQMEADGRNAGPHRNAFPHEIVPGLRYVPSTPLKKDWMTQLLMYGYTASTEYGTDNYVQKDRANIILGIEQLAFKLLKPSGGGEPESDSGAKKEVRIFSSLTYRLKPTPTDFENVQDRLYAMWSAVSAEHYFTNITKEESDVQVEKLANADAALLRMLTETW